MGSEKHVKRTKNPEFKYTYHTDISGLARHVVMIFREALAMPPLWYPFINLIMTNVDLKNDFPTPSLYYTTGRPV